MIFYKNRKLFILTKTNNYEMDTIFTNGNYAS